MTKSDCLRFYDLLSKIRRRPLPPLPWFTADTTAPDLIAFVSKNHLEAEYNRIDTILYKNGFVGAVLTLTAVYIAHFDD